MSVTSELTIRNRQQKDMKISDILKYCLLSDLSMRDYLITDIITKISPSLQYFFYFIGVIFTYGKHLQTKDQQFIDSLQQYEFVEPKLSESFTVHNTGELPVCPIKFP